MNKKRHSHRNFSLITATGRALLIASVLALAACATHQHSPSSADRFNKADENKDGKLSRGEVSDYLVAEIFASRDADHDARLTLQEWSGGDPARAAEFKKRDTNKDGIVTTHEAIEYGRAQGIAKEIVREADKNKDGALDKAELEAYYASREGPSR